MGRKNLTSVLVVLVVTILTIAGCSSSEEVTPEETAQQAVDAAFALFNAGDVDAWVEIRLRGSAFASDEEREKILEWMRTEEFGPRMAEGAQYEDIACESHGSGEWPVADAGPVEGYYLTCDTSLVAGDGSEVGEAFEWVVADGEVVAVRSNR